MICRCPHCGEGFHHQTAYDTHINVVHLKKSTHFCDVCGKGFPHASRFSSHMKKHHTQDLRCNRPGCDQTFTMREKLYKHLLVHLRDVHGDPLDIQAVEAMKKSASEEATAIYKKTRNITKHVMELL